MKLGKFSAASTFLAVALVVIPTAAAARGSSDFLVTDPMVGTKTTDLNTVFWRWQGFVNPLCAAPAVTIGNGLTLSGDASTLGGEQDWALRGDFRITIFLEITPGTRVHFTVEQHSVLDPTVIISHGITGNSSTGHTGVFVVFGGSAYFLIERKGSSLSIRQGNSLGVDEMDPVVASGELGVGADNHFFTLLAQTGCSSLGGSIRMKDFRLEADEILPRNSGRPVAPAEWQDCGDN